MLKYGLTKLEYKLTVSLVKQSMLSNIENESDDIFIQDVVRIPAKGISKYELMSLMNKGILNGYMVDKEVGVVAFEFQRQFIVSDSYKSMQLMDKDIVNSLRTEGGMQLYEHMVKFGKYAYGERESILGLDELRSIFECRESTYSGYKDLRVRKIDPAINDLNRAGYPLKYVVIKQGVKVNKVRLYIKEGYQDVREYVDKDYRIQEAIGRVAKYLFAYSQTLASSPKDYEEYELAYGSRMWITNYDSDKETCVRVRVFRRDEELTKAPLIVYAGLKDDEVIYTIKYMRDNEFMYERKVKTEYGVIVALENLKRAILQGEDLSTVWVDIENENALNVPLIKEDNIESLFKLNINYQRVMNIMDEYNKIDKGAFRYSYLVACSAISGRASMNIEYKGMLWYAQLNDAGYSSNVGVLKSLNGERIESNPYNIIEFFKIICGEDMDQELSVVIDKELENCTES